MEDISYNDDFKTNPKKAQSIGYNIEQCKICGSYHLRLNKSRHDRTRSRRNNYVTYMFQNIVIKKQVI